MCLWANKSVNLASAESGTFGERGLEVSGQGATPNDTQVLTHFQFDGPGGRVVPPNRVAKVSQIGGSNSLRK